MTNFDTFLKWLNKTHPYMKLTLGTGRWLESILKYKGDAHVTYGRSSGRLQALELLTEYLQEAQLDQQIREDARNMLIKGFSVHNVARQISQKHNISFVQAVDIVSDLRKAINAEAANAPVSHQLGA